MNLERHQNRNPSMDMMPKFMQAHHQKHDESGKEAVCMDITLEGCQGNLYCETGRKN